MLIELDSLRSWIVHEDEDLLVVNKPGDVVCHPSKQGPFSSLVGACREYLGLATVHLAHRLDRETSGLVVLAKHKKSARLAQMAVEHRQVEKTYHAILEGRLAGERLVEGALARDLESPVYIRQAVRSSHSSQAAVTRFRPLAVAAGDEYTLAAVTPVTGRKHQIRCHAEWIGHPIVGDKIYGPDDTLYLEFIEKGWTARLEAVLPMKRQALHASALRFFAPGFQAAFFAPLPPDMESFCRDKGLGVAQDPNRLRDRA